MMIVAGMWVAAAPARAGDKVSIESMSCYNVPDDIMAQSMQGVWTDTGKTCMSCMACGCSCIVEGLYVMDGLRIDSTKVSCEGKTYTLVAGSESYKCDSISVKSADDKKQFGGDIHNCDLTSADWEAICFAYPGAQLISERSREIDYEGGRDTVRGYSWQVFMTLDDFTTVNAFYRKRLGQEVRAMMANGKPMAVFPIAVNNSSVTVTWDEWSGKVYITLFKNEYAAE